MSDRNATVSEIISALRLGEGDYVRWVPSGKRVKPLEIWIASLATWVRADGHHYNGDLGRGYVYPGWFDRWRIRRAVRAWEDETGAFWEGEA